jgi:hypothetical protein
MNLDTRSKRIIYRTGPKCSAFNVSLSASIAVWHDEGFCGHRAWQSNIFLYSRRTSKLRQLTRNGISNSPATNGRYVAWSQGASRFSTGPVVLLDLKTGHRIIVSNSCSNSRPGQCKVSGTDRTDDPPAMSASVMDWASDATARLYARDLATGKEYLVQNDISGPGGIADDNYLGTPSGHTIVWQDQEGPLKFGIATVP